VDEDGDPARREVFLADLAQSRARREWAWPGLDVEEAPASVFIGGVRAALDHIGAGDVYQVNLSRPWSARLADGAEAAGLYRRLVRSNPGPFAGLARHEGRTLVSSSPERLLRVVRGCIETRPIAGTRPRGSDEAADRRLQRALRESAKERAEHVMLIDLERNDLGRICVSGSVKVDELMVLESYAHVHHIVSNVSGTLRAGVTPGEVIAAVFPGGTITGCPKVRCMEIIGRLEGEPRGAYTGSMGYLNHDGSCDLNILIRTVELGDGLARFRAGSGIVADSVPERELDETRAKARGLLLALGR
jgi:anthranilate synthase component 1